MNQDEIEMKYSYNEKTEKSLIDRLTKPIDVTRTEKEQKNFCK